MANYKKEYFRIAQVVFVLLLTTCRVRGREHEDLLGATSPDKPLLSDPSFEKSSAPNQFGQVFPEWNGWLYEGDAAFRVGHVARTGRTSCLLFGAGEPKIRIFKDHDSLNPGRYQVTAYIRGLNIGKGKWNQTVEFAFGDRYIPLDKNGTFGWTKLTYIGEVQKREKVIAPSFGLMAPGYLWIDDVEMKRVDAKTPLTEKPILENEETPIACTANLKKFTRCSVCGYKNPRGNTACCACGEELHRGTPASATPIKLINSFESRSILAQLNVLSGQSQETEHVTHGAHSLKLRKGYVSILDGVQDWTGFDYLLFDLYALGSDALAVTVEIGDDKTDNYWTRVNYTTVIPTGTSTLRIPIDQLYVGEKSRPGRKLNVKAVTKLVLSLEKENVGIYLDNVRLTRDTETGNYLFDGLNAFDLGTQSSPLMPGFTRIDASTLYNPAIGYGLKDARIWRSFDVLQPDPLYQDFICIERGGIAVDVPNGAYEVYVNMDSPSGYWGEYQAYSERKLLIEGRETVTEQMTFDSFKQKYFRHWLTEDTPTDDTYTKYQEPYFNEHLLKATVADGQLNIDFFGENWACAVSTVVVFPETKRNQGTQFLAYTRRKQREFFNNDFKRVLHEPTGDTVAASTQAKALGFIPFVRDYMKDVFHNDRPLSAESEAPVINGAGFSDETEPMTVALFALEALKEVTVSISDLRGPGVIPKDQLAVGYVSNRISRMTPDGHVYTIAPRFVIPSPTASVPANSAIRFWITVHVPRDALPGDYTGALAVTASNGKSATLPVAFHVYKGTLDPVDVPVGPWGHTINLPWLSTAPETIEWNRRMANKSLRKLRDSGFTSFSGIPELTYRGFKDGTPVIDFAKADEQMRMAKDAGFTMPVVSYTAFNGLNLYYRDESAMVAAGFKRYDQFVGKMFSAIQTHASEHNWLPVFWNIGDEPIGDDVTRAIDNARAYRQAFPKGPPFFTAATSFSSSDPDDRHFQFAKTLHVANLNAHDQSGISKLQAAGGKWGYYNHGSRFAYGVYLYKAAKQFQAQFCLSWHWNISAGDPYYALDCREDDYAWVNTGPDGTLVTSVAFEREMREGIDDYRYLITLSNLAKRKNAKAALKLIESRLSTFDIGEADKGCDYRQFRQEMANAIEGLRQ